MCVSETMLVLLCLITLSLHLNGVEAAHVHLHQSVLPVAAWDSEIMNTAGNKAEILFVFQEAVVTVVYRERALCLKHSKYIK